MSKRLSILLCSLCFLLSLQSQTADSVYARILRQLSAFPQEKVYLRTHAETFLPGQRVWMRAFVVNALSHEPSAGSQYVYVELYNPAGTLLKRVRLARGEKGFAGYIDLPSAAGRGRYILRSYTLYSANVKGFECVKSIFVGGVGRLLAPVSQAGGDGRQASGPLLVSRKGGSIRVLLNRQPKGDTPFFLLAHCRAYPFHFCKIKPHEALVFCEDSMPQGMVSFLLLDRHLAVVAGRLVYSDAGQERCRLQLQAVRVADSLEYRIAAPQLRSGETMDLSVSIAADMEDEPEGGFSDILTHLFLSSDLSGGLELPANMSHADAESLLADKEWSRYDMPRVLQGTVAAPPRAPEQTGSLTGRVVSDLWHKPVNKCSVNLISPEGGFFAVAQTNVKGEFSFEGLDYPEGTTYVLNAFRENGKATVELSVAEPEYPEFATALPPFAWLKGLSAADSTSLLSDNPDGIMLDKVEVMGRMSNAASRSDAYARQADFSFGRKEIEEIDATCLHELLRRVPGVQIKYDLCYIRGPISIKKDTPAAIAIDGVFLSGDYDLDNIQMQDVARVDIFKGGSTVIWGAQGSAGVISISTKRGGGAQKVLSRSNTKTVNLLGYQRPARFVPSDSHLYWNPSFGGGSFVFRKPAGTDRYKIVAEGVTSEGRVIHEVWHLKASSASVVR